MLLSGYHAIEERLRSAGGEAGDVLFLSRRNARTAALERLARDRGVRVVWIEESELARLAGRVEARGALLRAEGAGRRQAPGLAARLEGLEDPQALVLLLDGVTDPQNLGAILRCADQLAVDLVVVTSRRAAGGAETIWRASAGASAYVPLATVANLARAIQLCKSREFWVYGADLTGEPVHRVELSGRVALVLGSEGAGLHRLVRERCDALVRIPAGGRVDSFNVAVAAGILLYEVRRQQGFPFLRGTPVRDPLQL